MNSFYNIKNILFLSAVSAALVSLSGIDEALAQRNTSPIPANSAAKSSVGKKMDSLGQNSELMNLAKSLDPQNRTRIVQDRIVKREGEVEVSFNFGAVAGGDSYLKTQTLGVQLEYHLNPKWSIGVRYQDHGNTLTSEGKRVFEQARNNFTANRGEVSVISDIDAPQSSYFGSLSWYPIYGKLNWFDKAVSHFDFYLLGGVGQMNLSSGSTLLLTGGAGVGIWFQRRVCARFELRSQHYQDKDQIYVSSRNLNTINGSFGLGYVF